jgi:hypothetical protein
MKKLLLFITICCWLNNGIAQEVNFSEHIAPIIYNHCTTCHRPGEIAPFPLTNYEQVKAWAPMIAYVTGIKYMPPWKPDPNYQTYQRENYLTDAEIKQIADWVAQGTKRGNTALEPPLPVFPTGSQVGTPDLVLSFRESYLHKGTNQDVYRFFVLPTGLTEDKDLIALEVRPGNNAIVHHALVWEDTTGTSRAADEQTPEYGYETVRGNSLNALNSQLPGYVPGMRPMVFSHGIAQRLHAGADLRLQVHYAPTPVDERDSTTVNLFFARQPATRFLKSKVMIPFFGTLTNGPFVIPANQVREFHGTYQFTEDASLLNISPHMHKLGQRWEVFAIKPNKDTVKLIKINEWDFNWQGSYSFKKPIILPKGTVVHAFAKYDNTVNNPVNPNNPPKLITWGENTSDEMFYLPFSWVSYQPGDENLVFENPTTSTENPTIYSIQNELYPIAPNPATQQVKIGFTLASGGKATLHLFDVNGRLVNAVFTDRLYAPGLHTVEMDVSQQASGVYMAVLTIAGQQHIQKLVITK